MAQEEAAHLWVPTGVLGSSGAPDIWHSCPCGAARHGRYEWTPDKFALVWQEDGGGGDPHCVLGALVRNALRAFTESREVNR